jgi:hypothetical protein
MAQSMHTPVAIGRTPSRPAHPSNAGWLGWLAVIAPGVVILLLAWQLYVDAHRMPIVGTQVCQ